MTEGYYWVHPLQKEWCKPYIEYIEQDVIDYFNGVGWDEGRVKIIEKVKEPKNNEKADYLLMKAMDNIVRLLVSQGGSYQEVEARVQAESLVREVENYLKERG